jgi:hypothetical protein
LPILSKWKQVFLQDFFPLLWIVPFLQYCSKYILEIYPVAICHNDFSLWFGEAKFYRNIDIAITSAVDSVDAFLRNDDQIKKENSLLHYLENFAYKRFLAQQARQNNDLS